MTPAAAHGDALAARLAFLLEADRLKSVLRATPLANGARPENSAEHSWHLALFALVLAEDAPEGADIDRAIRMLLLHDLVEIDAGDSPIHAAHRPDPAVLARAEAAAAQRLFGLLPPAQGAQFHALWTEFEAGETPTARFARALDRAQPPLLNHAAGGGSWAQYDVTWAQMEARVGAPVRRGAPRLWAALAARIRPWFAARGRDSEGESRP